MPKDDDFVQWVAGTLVIKDSIPVAHRYGGYQFGHWVSNFKNFKKSSVSALYSLTAIREESLLMRLLLLEILDNLWDSI